MRIFSAAEAREIDLITINQLGISGVSLMKKAGLALAEKVASLSIGGRTGIICGKGNNGGDGYSCGVALQGMGLECEIISLESADSLNSDSQHFYSACIDLGIPINHNFIPEDINLSHFDIIVDGLLGTGISGDVRPETGLWIEAINSAEGKIISIDIPSGLNGTNGSICGIAIQADYTVSMGFLKQGIILQPGKSLAGKVVVADLDYPEASLGHLDVRKQLIDHLLPTRLLKPIQPDIYKHRQGKLLIIAGSRGFTGAAILAANAAMRSGAGIVLCVVPESLNEIFENKLDEPMTLACADKGKGFLDQNALPKILEKLEWCNAILLGPGLGTDPAVGKLVRGILEKTTKPVLVDADALTHVNNDPNVMKNLKKIDVLTPHHGEAAKFFGVDRDEISNDPFEFAHQSSMKTGSIVVLKGSPTLTAFRGQVITNTTGHQGLASAGTGDVLSGIIASFLCQSFSAEAAAQMGVFIHGQCADRLLEAKGYRGLIASDLIEVIPSVLSEHENS